MPPAAAADNDPAPVRPIARPPRTGAEQTMSLTTPSCPDCGAELTLGASGNLNCWSCPAGHGLGFTMTAAYGRLQDDEIAAIWSAAASAPEASRKCPVCERAMVTVTVGVDADEDPAAAKGSPELTLEVCREDEFYWLDPGELDELPVDVPNAAPSAEEQHNLAVVRQAFDAGIDQAEREAGERGILNRMAGTVARNHSGFAGLLDRAAYRGDLAAEHAKTQAEWDAAGGAQEDAA